MLVWLTLALLALDGRLRRRPRHRVRCAGARVPARARAAAADRPRDPQLAAREERVPRHQPAAGRRELDLPAAHGGARAREVRAAPASRGRGTGSARGCSTMRSGDSCSRCCCPSCAAGRRPRQRRATGSGIRWSRRCSSPASWIPIEALLIAALAHDAGQVAVRRLPAVLDLRRLCAPRRARRSSGAALQARVPRLVGGRGLRLPAARAVPGRGRVREARARTRRPTGTSRRIASSPTGPPGVLNAVTGVCGLAAMLWLYGVAWHQPMADSIAWARATIADALPVAARSWASFSGDAARSAGIAPPTPMRHDRRPASAPPARRADAPAARRRAPIDAELAAQFAERRRASPR